MKVVFCAPQAKAHQWVEPLSRLLPEAEVFAFEEAGLRQADYAVVWAPDPALFEQQKQLQAIFNLGAGVDALLRMPNLPDIPLVRLGDAGMAVQMAEYVAHWLVRFARSLDSYEAQKAKGEWQLLKPTPRHEFPVGIMGLGAIGARVAATVAALEYPTFGWSRTAKSIDGVHCYSGAGALPEFASQVRVLVCLLPLTPDTENILNRELLGRLKPDAMLINVARGAHLVDEDLIDLMNSGAIKRAVLDVFRQEPLPANHPFWAQSALVMTPHISARTLREDSVAQIAGKILCLSRGEAIDGIVERRRGY